MADGNDPSVPNPEQRMPNPEQRMPPLVTAAAKCEFTTSECNQFLQNALILAVENNSLQCVRDLINDGANVNCFCTQDTPLQIASRMGHKELVEVLIQLGAEIDASGSTTYSPLMIAAKLGNSEVVQLLIKLGADVNLTSIQGRTPLMLAGLHSRTALSADSINRYAECTCCLLQAAATVDAADKDGKTALMLAVHPHTIIMELILKARANPNIKGVDGKTALMNAAEHNLVNCCELLINFGADMNKIDMNGRTAFMYVTDIHCLELMLSKTVVIKTLQDGTIVHYPRRSQYKSQANLNIQDRSGQTALIHACRKRLSDCCSLLIRYFVDVNIPDNKDRTALMYATTKSSIFLLCTTAGADMEHTDMTDYTALAHLLNNKDRDRETLENVNLLLECGADPVLNPIHRSLLKLDTLHSNTMIKITNQSTEHFTLEMLIVNGYRQWIRLLVCNGIVVRLVQTLYIRGRYDSPFGCALMSGCVDVVKYFIACNYMTQHDLSAIRRLIWQVKLYSQTSNLLGHHIFYENNAQNSTMLLLQEMVCQPWPLVKLAFIMVSSCLGMSPEREQRITKINLPPRVQRMLMFQEPVSRLPVSQWSDIPLCFNPVEYEKLPNPRPLLYYWPIGRDMTTRHS